MANFPRRYFPEYSGVSQAPGLSYGYGSDVPLESGIPRTRPVYVKEYPPISTTQGASNTAATQPTPATTTSTKQKGQVINKRYKYYGYALMFMALAILGLEIGNIVYTYNKFEVSSLKNAFIVPYILTWIAPGIWGAIPLFITGYLALRVAGKYNNLVRIFALFCSLSSTVFCPAIIAISTSEIILYGNSTTNSKSASCYNFGNSSTLSCPKFILPLIVDFLAGLCLYLTLMTTIIFCCCWNPPDEPTETETRVVDEYYPYARNPPISAQVNPPMRLAPPQVYPEMVPVYRSAGPTMFEPDMNLLRARPFYRPTTSSGFGFAPAFNRQSYGGGFPGTMPSLTSFGGAYEPNAAYRIAY